MKTLRIAATSLLVLGALVACSDDTDEADTQTAGPEVVEPDDSAVDDDTDIVDEGADVEAGPIDTSKGGDLTCDEWRAASRDEKLETSIVYLEGAGLPAAESDASLAAIDIDVYCAGTSHANDPIQPGFEGGQ